MGRINTNQSEEESQLPIKTKIIKKKKKKAKTRTLSSGNKFQVVPWANGSEWDAVCAAFKNEDWSTVLAEILIWRERVPALPVGVESTYFLAQALVHENNPKTLLTCDEKRSLYSLAVIRFLNHVSHLATKEMGGTSVLPMYQLASHVDVPEWIVKLRHDASHGVALPSLEILMRAAKFTKMWLKENYWVHQNKSEPPSENTIKLLSVENPDQVEAKISDQIGQLVSSFIATRIYKLRGCPIITDEEILRHLPNRNTQNVKIKTVAVMLRKKLDNFIVTEPEITCAVIAQNMTAEEEFLEDFSAIFQRADSFEQVCVVLQPVIKLLQTKGKLVILCAKLAEIQTSEEANENTLRLCAVWLDYILEKIQTNQSHDSSVANELSAILPTLLKSPNAYTNIFVNRLFEMVENKIGSESISKLKALLSIWCPDDSSNFNLTKYKRMQGALPKGEFFTCEKALEEPGQSELTQGFDEPVVINSLDKRGSKFWRKIPFGAFMGDYKPNKATINAGSV